MPPCRVVILSKRHRLTAWLAELLAAEGMLAGIVNEERMQTRAQRWQLVRRNAKREGWLHTANVVAWEGFQRLAYPRDFTAACDRIIPLAHAGDPPGVPVITVENLNAPEAREQIAALNPDLLVVHATGILKPATFQLGRVAALNIHCGVLPEYRGHATTFWAMAKGDVHNVGVTVHHVAATVDTGAPVAIVRVPVGPTDDDITMWVRAFQAGALAVRDAARALSRGEPMPQTEYVGAFGPHYIRRGLTQHLRFRAFTLPRLQAAARRG